MAVTGGCSGTGTLGGDGDTSGSGSGIRASQYTAGANICVAQAKTRCYGTNGQKAKIGVWADNGSDSLGTLIAASAELTMTTNWDYYTVNFSSSFQITSGTKYWIGLIPDGGACFVAFSTDTTPITKELSVTGYATCAVSVTGDGTAREYYALIGDTF